MKKKKIAIIVLSVLIVLIGGGLGTYYYLFAKGQEQLKESESVEREGTFVTFEGKEYKYNEDMINILVLGIDKKGNIEEEVAQDIQGLADTVLVASLDTKDHDLHVLAIPRDTMTKIRRVDQNGKFYDLIEDKLTLQYGYGKGTQESCELMEETVSNLLFRLPIQRYVSMDMDAIPILNDAVGGVDVVVPETVQNSDGKLYFTEGEQVHLEGEEALYFVRIRNIHQNGSAMGRLNRQKQYVEKFYQRAKSAVKNDVMLPLTIYNELQPYMFTNLNVEDVTYLGTELLKTSFSPEDLIQIPGEATFDENYKEGRTVFHVNEDELQKLIIELYYEPVEAK